MDARYYLNQFGRPALAYCPVARNIHAAGEAVELDSIVRGAPTLAKFIATYYADRGLGEAALDRRHDDGHDRPSRKHR